MNYIRDLLHEDESAPQVSSMMDYYRGKVVLLTGGTGFLGNLYVEKLLRIGVKSLYLVIRSKQGKSPEERISELFSGVVYKKLHQIDPNYLKRIRAIEGDMDNEKFGISREDMIDIQNNVQICIHSAANVRFEDNLASLIKSNVMGTKEVLKICEEIKHLQVFTHISTAYSHCVNKNIDEKFYETPIDPEVMIRLMQKYGESDELNILQDRIVQPWPNNYTYSKALSEEVVRQWAMNTNITTCVIRPTIIISTAEDPLVGWTNNMYGLNGIAAAVGFGAIRIIRLTRNAIGDIVCADFVVNSTLAATWVTYEESKKEVDFEESPKLQEPKIYHVSSTKDSPVTWGEVVDKLGMAFQEYPAKRMLWKHCLHTTESHIMKDIWTFYYHIVPAYLLDLYWKLTNNKLRILPKKRKAQRFMVMLEYFMSRGWNFGNNNMRSVIDRMSETDQNLFPCDIRRWKWSDYCYDYMHGLKLYMMNETMNDAMEARHRYKKLQFAHYVVLFFYYLLHSSMYYSILKYNGIFESIEHTIRDTYEFIQNPN